MSCQEEQQEEIETIGELIENFVGDLVDGTYSNGSDERMYAQQWFERCWFGIFPEDYLNAMDNIKTAKEEKKYLEEHPEEADEEEASYLDDDIADWEEELKSMREDWKPENEPNMDEEIERIKKWVTDRNLFLIINKRRQKIMTK